MAVGVSTFKSYRQCVGRHEVCTERERERPVAESSDDLFTLLTEIWNSMDALPAISSMRRRLVATIDSVGGLTKY